MDPSRDESLPSILRPPEQKNYDIFNPKDFVELLKLHIPRPFIFGPVDFEDLQEVEQPFDAEYWHDAIMQTFLRSPYLPAEDILVHGLRVLCKGRTLKRASSIVKHSRFLRNLQVTAVLPPELDPKAMLHQGTEEEVAPSDDE